MKGVPMYIVTIRDSGQKRAIAREIYVTGVKKTRPPLWRGTRDVCRF